MSASANPPDDRRPRLGELLTSAGLLSSGQLEETLALARAQGKPLGQVLVENQIVPAHSIAMALADQHGGPLKTEFGFATGRRKAVPVEKPLEEATTLRLAPIGGGEPPAVPARPLMATTAPAPTVIEPAVQVGVVVGAEAERRSAELRARVEELEAAAVRAAEKDARNDELLATALTTHETLRAELADLKMRDQTDHAAVAEADQQLAATRDKHSLVVAEVEKLRTEIAALRANDERARGELAHLREQLAASAAEADTHSTALRELRAERDMELSGIASEAELRVEAVRAELEELRSQQAEQARPYAADRHVLFLPSAGRYEILERSGPAPAVGALVELSGGRACRVLRVGPSPLPGGRDACAFLEDAGSPGGA